MGKAKKGPAVRRKAEKAARKSGAAKPVFRFRLRELDPKAKCGEGTSVERLFQIDEDVPDGPPKSHLVFFDRHGWYCLHGRACPAVQHARKLEERK